MPANVHDSSKFRRRKVAVDNSVAAQTVREWTSDRRDRIRSALLLGLRADDPDVLARPEMQLVALIDKISSEEG